MAESVNVNLLTKVFKLLLVLHAETLLLVDYDQAKIVRVHIAREQAMRAHEHVHLARRKPLERHFGLGLAAEAG